jgi:hypothetical protein
MYDVDILLPTVRLTLSFLPAGTRGDVIVTCATRGEEVVRNSSRLTSRVSRPAVGLSPNPRINSRPSLSGTVWSHNKCKVTAMFVRDDMIPRMIGLVKYDNSPQLMWYR